MFLIIPYSVIMSSPSVTLPLFPIIGHLSLLNIQCKHSALASCKIRSLRFMYINLSETKSYIHYITLLNPIFLTYISFKDILHFVLSFLE